MVGDGCSFGMWDPSGTVFVVSVLFRICCSICLVLLELTLLVAWRARFPSLVFLESWLVGAVFYFRFVGWDGLCFGDAHAFPGRVVSWELCA